LRVDKDICLRDAFHNAHPARLYSRDARGREIAPRAAVGQPESLRAASFKRVSATVLTILERLRVGPVDGKTPRPQLSGHKIGQKSHTPLSSARRSDCSNMSGSSQWH